MSSLASSSSFTYMYSFRINNEKKILRFNLQYTEREREINVYTHELYYNKYLFQKKARELYLCCV